MIVLVPGRLFVPKWLLGAKDLDSHAPATGRAFWTQFVRQMAL